MRDREWLVGDKCSYADLSFLTWAAIAPNILNTTHEEIDTEYPNYGAWLKKMNKRPSVIDMLKEKEVIAPPEKRYQLDHKIDDEQKKKMDEEVKLAKRGSNECGNGVSNGGSGTSNGYRPGETCTS